MNSVRCPASGPRTASLRLLWERRPAGDGDLYDLLITADVLAEGVNLRQCRHIVNFNMS